MSKFYFKALCEFCSSSTKQNCKNNKSFQTLPQSSIILNQAGSPTSICCLWSGLYRHAGLTNKQTAIQVYAENTHCGFKRLVHIKVNFIIYSPLCHSKLIRLICWKVLKNTTGFEEYPCHRHTKNIKQNKTS